MVKSLYDFCIEQNNLKLLAQWDTEINGSLTVKQVSYGNHRKVPWIYNLGHQWEAPVYSRTISGSGCPYCTNHKVSEGYNDLATTAPKVAKEWHPDLNGALTHQAVTSGSGKRVWRQCPEGHVWKAVIYSRTGSQMSGCPVCSGKVKENSKFHRDEHTHKNGDYFINNKQPNESYPKYKKHREAKYEKMDIFYSVILRCDVQLLIIF